MILGVDPKIDYAFKRLFGLDRNRDILIDLLHAVLEPPVPITDVEILNPFNPKETDEDKLSIVDIKVRDQLGRLFNVEMQMVAHRSLPARLLYYWARLFQQQLHEGEKYGELRPTVTICFLDAVLFPAVPDHHLHFRLLDPRHGIVFTDVIEVHLLELPKFASGERELTNALERWLFFLRHAELLDADAVPSSLNVPKIQRAVQELKMITQNDLERELYESRLKQRRDEISRLHDAESVGAERGLKRGLEQGREQGVKQGLLGQIQMCQRLLKRAQSPDEELLKLSVNELQTLAEELEQELVSKQ